MPVYEFHCEECDCRFEEYREVKQRAACPCPTCGKPARKTFRPVGIIFKGSGFHVTDYPTSGSAARRESESPKTGAGIGSDKDTKKD